MISDGETEYSDTQVMLSFESVRISNGSRTISYTDAYDIYEE